MYDQIDIFSQIHQFYEKIISHYSLYDLFAQVLALIICISLAYLFAYSLAHPSKPRGKVFLVLQNNPFMSFFEFSFYSIFILFLVCSRNILHSFDGHSWLITIVMYLIIGWIALKLTFSLTVHSRTARLIALAAWLFALLTLFGTQASLIDGLRRISINIGKAEISLLFIIEALMTFAAVLLTARILSSWANLAIDDSASLSSSHKVLYKELVSYFFYIAAGFTGFIILGIDITIITVFSGTLGFGIGMGLSRVISNFIAGLVLLLDKSIKPGDLLMIEGKRGTVNHMHPRYVSVLTRDGQNILVPNEAMMNEKVHNLSYENTYMQLSMPLSIAYGNDINFVKDTIEAVLLSNPDIIQSPEPVCYAIELNENFIKFELRYWVDETSAHPSKINHDLLILILEALDNKDIQLYRHVPVSSKPIESQDVVKPKSTKGSKKKS